MNTVYFENENLEITDDYIMFDNKVMPTSALSFFSVHAYDVNWWVPILSIIAGIVGLIYFDNDSSGILQPISIIVMIFGLYKLIMAFVDSKKRICEIVSHSGKSITFETETEDDVKTILAALFETISCDEEGGEEDEAGEENECDDEETAPQDK